MPVSKPLPREIFSEIKPYLDTDNVIVLHGSRQVGKSSLMKYIQNYLKTQDLDSFYLDLEDYQILEVLDSGIENFLAYLQGEGWNLANYQTKNQRLFILIDEIQYLKNPSSFLKLLADHHKYLQLIVSGSSSFEIKSKFKDSLVGRTVNFEIFGLSFTEFLIFKGISANILKSDLDIHIQKLKGLYQEYLQFGCYPKIILEPEISKKEKYLKQIIQTYIQKDIKDLAKIEDLNKFNKLLKLLASQSGNLVNVSQLSSLSGLSRPTIDKYLFLLEQTYIIKLVYPYSQSPKIEVSKMPKVFFYDTGILQLLWLQEFSNKTLGNIFETMVFSQLVKKYGKDKIKFWRNKNQNEIDFILEEKEVLPIEVKLNFQQFRKGSIQGFLDNYDLKNYKVVGLDGVRIEKGFYAWQI